MALARGAITHLCSGQMFTTAPRFRFSTWPNPTIPAVAAGVYAIWKGDGLIYCGMSGREYERAVQDGKKKYGLVTRLASHASGRLGGDQFCVYVANRLVIPSLKAEHLAEFEHGEITLDTLTKRYIHAHLEYQYVTVPTSKEAYGFEMQCRSGAVFGIKPWLNPL